MKAPGAAAEKSNGLEKPVVGASGDGPSKSEDSDGPIKLEGSDGLSRSDESGVDRLDDVDKLDDSDGPNGSEESCVPPNRSGVVLGERPKDGCDDSESNEPDRGSNEPREDVDPNERPELSASAEPSALSNEASEPESNPPRLAPTELAPAESPEDETDDAPTLSTMVRAPAWFLLQAIHEAQSSRRRDNSRGPLRWDDKQKAI